MPRYERIDFRGGINQQADASQVDLQSGEYYLLVNGRTRRKVIRPIHNPKEITAEIGISGKMQGIYSINSLQVVFVNGNAYWKDFDPETGPWQRVGGLQMSATVDRIWLELVPGSTINRRRYSSDAADAKAPIKLGDLVGASQQCAIVMDGVSQPWIIFPDANARITQTYAQWSPDNPEYVPIAKFPQKVGSILYCVGPDRNGVFNQLYRSVSGSPLNFVIAVTETGDKISSAEVDGGAPSLADRIDFGEATSLRRIPVIAGTFLYTTIQNSYIVTPNFDNLVYDEPTFDKTYLFNIGALNQECVVDLSGNAAIIHYSGIREFNAILTLKFEGKNSPFSQAINDLLADIVQTQSASIAHDNYAIFAVLTRYGPACIWYDTMTQKFVSVDIFREITSSIKQFSSVLTQTTRKLFFITEDDRIFEYDAGPTTATCRLYIKDFIPTQNSAEHSITDLQVQMGTVRTGGFFQTKVFADSRLVATQACTVEAQTQVDALVDSIPYTPSSDGDGKSLGFDYRNLALQAWRTGVMLEWDADCDLLAISLETQEAEIAVSESTKASPFIGVSKQIIAMVGNDGVSTESRLELLDVLRNVPADYIIGLGNHSYPDGTQDSLLVQWSPFWGYMRDPLGKYFAVPGPVELSAQNGKPFFQVLNQSPTRYFRLTTQWAEIFLMNSGINLAGAQVEADNSPLVNGKQFDWLERDLSLVGQRKHNIIVWSTPPYSSISDKSSVALRAIPLQEWGAHTLISGSAGLYERLIVDSFPYFIAGTGSLEKLESPLAIHPNSFRQVSQLGYLRLTLYPLSIVTEFVLVNGDIQDTFVIDR